VLRRVDPVSLIVGRVAGLVHEDAHRDPDERVRHERFLLTRLAAGVAAMACLPPYLVWRGVPTAPEYAAMLLLGGPILAAVLLSRTGMLTAAYAASAGAFTALVVCIAAASGGLASPAVVWLVAPALEALLFAPRRAAVAVSVIAAGGLVLVAGADVSGFGDAGSWPLAGAMLILLAATAAYAGAQALFHALVETAGRSAIAVRHARDRSLTAVMEDVVTWHDRNGHVVDADGGAKLFGVPPAALRGRGLFSRVHVSDRPAFLKAISDAATSDRPITVQLRVHVAEHAAGAAAHGSGGDARVIWSEMRVGRVEGASDGGVCAVAVTRDISAQTRHREDLETARADAERAGAANGQFLAMVSHELRTPLNAIIGFSEVLASESNPAVEPERRKEYLHIIRDSGEHLLQVVNTLLDVSKIEAGKFDVLPEPFDIGPFAHGCCDLMGLKAERAGIHLAREIATDLPELIADRRACKQMVINLLSNAIKFTPAGGRVTLAVRRERDHIVFGVSDTGIGISEEDLPRLGDPFFQARSAYDRRHEGTGLGLSVVRGLVGLHQGSLTIESAPDQGTAVTVSLPIDGRTAPLRKAAPVRIHALPRPSAPARTLKVG
jgi:two-component system, cell cycle sensor histidine kinase DivJ